FTIEPQGERLLVTVPGYRQDVEGRADLAEEVARVSGYDAIPETLPTGVPPESRIDPVRAAADRAKHILVGCGLQEVMTYSLVAAGSASRVFGVEGAASVEEIAVANAISSEQSVLRVTLLPSLLETARANLRHGDGVALFELANVYLPPLGPLPTEQPRLGIVLIGQATPTAWNAPRREADFFDLKGIIEELLASFGLAGRFRTWSAAGYQPGRCAEVVLGGGEALPVGLLGQLHPRVVEGFDLGDRRVYAVELRFDLLAQHAQPQPQIRPIPRLPGLDRDLALIVDHSTPHADLEAALRATAGELLERITLFDTYAGPPVPPGKKSLAYTLRFRARDRTLTDDEADAAVARLVTTVAERFGAVLRSG
ncbi:MAG: phenylalanine--tRNA ligase subunit beta, partial [Chloroflexi bacterium]|nr:phenylalanine--tRNA ligase subunit beta [Chloroflexota bacterium]